MKPTTWSSLAILLLVGVLLRVLLFANYDAVSYPDTGTYLEAARDLIAGEFTSGLGRRTPGYPLLIVLVGESPRAMMLANMVAGLLVSATLFGITMVLTKRRGLALAVGLSYSLNLQQLFQEGALLTETLSTLSVTAAVLVLVAALPRLQQGRRIVPMLWLIGALAGFAILVRPQFLVLLLLIPALVVHAVSGWRRPSRAALAAAAHASAPGVAMVLAWCTVVYLQVGQFTVSTQSGFGMVNHTIDYIERAPDRYAEVREVLLKTRQSRMAEVGHSRNTIWYAWPEIQRVTGWSLPEASRQLQRMCVAMIVDDPLRYALGVGHAWVDFWTVPILWKEEQLQPAAVASTLQALWWIEHKLLRLSNLLLVVVVLAAAVSTRVRRDVGWDAGMTAVAATVLLSSLIQALADQGASSRYAIPTQALVLLLLAVAGWRWRTARRSSGAALPVRPAPARS